MKLRLGGNDEKAIVKVIKIIVLVVFIALLLLAFEDIMNKQTLDLRLGVLVAIIITAMNFMIKLIEEMSK